MQPALGPGWGCRGRWLENGVVLSQGGGDWSSLSQEVDMLRLLSI